MIQDGIHALFFGFVYKATGINNYDVVVSFTALMHGVNIIGKQLPAQNFTIHHILTTAQRDNVNLVSFNTLCLHNKAAKVIKNSLNTARF